MKSADAKKSILIVEDVAILALALAEALFAAGFQVVGPAPSVAKALSLVARHHLDAAILDINLRGETSAPVACELNRRGTPFLAVTGYSDEQRPPVFHDAPTLTKPVREADLIAALHRCLESSSEPCREEIRKA